MRRCRPLWPLVVLVFVLQLCTLPVRAAQTFDLDAVAALARGIAAKPYVAPVDRLPAELRDLDYDGLRDIRFKPQQAIWRNDKLPDISAEELHSLINGEFWVLSSNTRSSGAGFVLKRTLATAKRELETTI